MGLWHKLPPSVRAVLDLGRMWYSLTGLGLLGSTMIGGISSAAIWAVFAQLPMGSRVGLVVAGTAAGLLAAAEVKRRFPVRLSWLNPSSRAIGGAKYTRDTHARLVVGRMPDEEKRLLESLASGPRPVTNSEVKALKFLREAGLVDRLVYVGEEGRNMWKVSPDISDIVDELLGSPKPSRFS